MDFQNRVGSKTGGGGATSWSESNRDRRERLRKLALETIDLAKDPYFMRNHLGTYECKLCLTLHNNEGSYLAHTQGKKHQSNLSRRAAKEAKKQQTLPAPEKPRVEIRKFVKIGRPGYKVTKQQDPESSQQSLLFQIDYPGIVEGIQPKYRVMAAFEQHTEAPDKAWQYLLFAAEPYETIAFKIPSREVDNTEGKFWNEWNPDTKQFFLQFMFKIDSHAKVSNLPPPAQLAAQGQQNTFQNTDREIGSIPMETAPPPPPPPAPTHNPSLISQQTFPNLIPMQTPSRSHFPPTQVNPMPPRGVPLPPHGAPPPRPPPSNLLQGPFHGIPMSRPPPHMPGPPHGNPFPGLPHGPPLPGPPHPNRLPGPPHGGQFLPRNIPTPPPPPPGNQFPIPGRPRM